MADRLFVYGTLAPGRSNEHWLRDVPGTWEPAAVRGHLVEEGWASTEGFPALTLDDDAPEVRGLVFTSEGLDELWPALDEFEGDGYARVVASFRCDSGETVEAYVYVAR